MKKIAKMLLHIIISFVVCFAIFMTGQFLYGVEPIKDNSFLTLIAAIVTVVLTLTVYWYYVKLAEKREVSELSKQHALKEFGIGFGIGTALLSSTVLILWISGLYKVVGVNSYAPVVNALALSLMAGFCEEILFRGILFRMIEANAGSWIALVISGLLFGLIHMGNEGATFISASVIALEAGILLGGAYILKRKLWFPMGIHTAWNFTQTGIFGTNLSGVESHGLFQSKLLEPAWVSGGNFGIEMSIIAIILCLLCSVIFIFLAIKKGNIIKFAGA
jgi:membrane protease YdiL (CAAX protease family)